MRRLLTLFLVTLVTLTIPSAGYAADIKITNPTLGTLSGGSTTVTFNVSWKASWRSATVIGNWDAAWVFVKFRKNGGAWAHASLNNTGHTVPTGSTLTTGLVDTGSSFNIATNPVVGVFIYRDSDGQGTFTANNVSLSWNYSQDGVTTGDTVEIRVFGIEMVYIPQGGFFAGDTSLYDASFKQGSNDNDPWWIESENAIAVTNSAGTGTGKTEKAAEYYYVTDVNSNDDDATGTAFTIPAAFPKGYQALYMMKGELSQGGWVTFFNTLTATQKTNRDMTSSSGKTSDFLANRNNVSWTGSGDSTLPDQGGGATYSGVAMSYISWADLTAYLDWAGLRPMSELEFERAGRGPQRPVSGEYAWGSTSIAEATSITNAGLPTEAPGNAANCVYNSNANVQGPMRVGAVAYGDTTRISGGFGYYGVVDLSGNVWERCVTVGNSTGRAFEGRYHGNGSLDSSGDANVSTWPGTNALGSGLRGGDWAQTFANVLKLSNRSVAGSTSTARNSNLGGRGVRVAP
jgi:formylglycine-generating enzyme required for sulfatase activity